MLTQHSSLSHFYTILALMAMKFSIGLSWGSVDNDIDGCTSHMSTFTWFTAETMQWSWRHLSTTMSTNVWGTDSGAKMQSDGHSQRTLYHLRLHSAGTQPPRLPTYCPNSFPSQHLLQRDYHCHDLGTRLVWQCHRRGLIEIGG